MATDMVSKRTPWTDSAACKSRQHCDYCPFVLARRPTPAGDRHILSLDPVYDINAGLLNPGILARRTAPRENQCPHGITFEQALEVRKERLLANVARGVVDAEQAMQFAEWVGVSLDAEEV